jgi:hypothetical protein
MFPVMTGALVRIDPFTFTSLRYLIAGRTFAQDQSLPNQASTFQQHAQADANNPRGRYELAQVTTATVIGSKPEVASAYPAAAPHQHDPCGLEPPLGYRIDELEPSMAFVEIQAGEPADAPSSSVSPGLPVERAGPSRPYRRY